jgi:uncharacterized protein (DUF1330 family)
LGRDVRTGTYVEVGDGNTVIVVMDMHNVDKAREFATSPELAAAREQAAAIGSPDDVWYGAQQMR